MDFEYALKVVHAVASCGMVIVVYRVYRLLKQGYNGGNGSDGGKH